MQTFGPQETQAKNREALEKLQREERRAESEKVAEERRHSAAQRAASRRRRDVWAAPGMRWPWPWDGMVKDVVKIWKYIGMMISGVIDDYWDYRD